MAEEERGGGCKRSSWVIRRGTYLLPYGRRCRTVLEESEAAAPQFLGKEAGHVVADRNQGEGEGSNYHLDPWDS